MLDQKEIQNIKKIKGEVRGVVFHTDLKYVEKVEGKGESEDIVKAFKELEPEFEPEKIQNMKWYPLRWRVLLLLIIKKSFNWVEDDLYEMGRTAPTNSFMVKTLLKYFVGFEKTCREAPKYWNKHYNKGELELSKFDDKEKVVIYRLRDFDVHPVFCPYLTGYFQGIAELTNRGSTIRTKETKCSFQNHPYHEYFIKWE